jgi:diacylglycerol kinase family enzyme
MPPPRTKILINAGARAGQTEPLQKRLIELLGAGGIDADISPAGHGQELSELAQAAAADNYDLVVAGGGDGTVNAVASAIIGTEKTLGVLPLGTLNHFAKDLKIPLDFDAAVQNLIAGKSIKIDVGEVNGRIFLNNSSLGLYPHIVHERERQQRLGAGKWPAFVWAAITALRRYPFLNVRLTVEGEEFARRTPFVFIGNNEYIMEQLNIGIRECLDKGELSLYMGHLTGRWGLARLALRALLGRLSEEKDFLAMCTREVTIMTRHKRLRVAFDGEIDILETPLEYRVRPRALRVIVPDEEDQ